MKIGFLVVLVWITALACQSPLREDRDLLNNMMERREDQFRYYLDHRDSLEIQIIYTQINRDTNNRPTFRSFLFNVDSSRYFYPASTVKLPMVLLSLEKLNHLGIPGLDKYTPVFHDSVYSGQVSVLWDTTSPDCLPSIAHYAKKILITSDNDAHNRLYEFLGQAEANRLMASKGYQIRLLHRLDRALTPDENRHTEAVRFVRHDTILYRQPMMANDSIPVSQSVCKGIGYFRNDTLVKDAFDFSYKNFYPLMEQQQVLKALLFPESVPPRQRFDLTADDRRWVLQNMSQLPTETMFPPYHLDTTYFPAYAKFLMFGDSRDPIPSSIRIFNKIGDAYGYLIDNAYIVDFENNVEFMLSAVIHVNRDGIFNDEKYEYETLGYPFMRDLGQLVYQYERDRKRTFRPNLNEFRFQYLELSRSK